MTDLPTLIRRMADELDHYQQVLAHDRSERYPLATEARAALTEVQGEGPAVRRCRTRHHTQQLAVALPAAVRRVAHPTITESTDE